jgi:hypothetical protein
LRVFADVCRDEAVFATTMDRICELQARCGIEDLCSEDCLYFELGGSPRVGCLYKNADVTAMPEPIARQLLKAAGRSSRKRRLFGAASSNA